MLFLRKISKLRINNLLTLDIRSCNFSTKMEAQSDVFCAKKTLRKEMKKVVSEISKEDKNGQSKSVAQQLLNDPVYINSK